MEWSSFQNEIFHATKHDDANLSIQAVAGSGKCLEKDTPVIMADGSIKLVQNIVVGESVMGPDSSPRNVLSTMSGTSKMHRIVPVKGDSWVCNDSHILTLYRWRTKKVVDVNIQDILNKVAYSPFHTEDGYTDAKLIRVPINFQEKEIFVDPYLLGVWLGDGNSNDSIIYLTEKSVYDGILSSIHRHGIDRVNLTGSGSCLKVSLRTEYNSNPLRRYFRNNCKINSDKKIPFEYLTNSEYVRLEVLAGLIDTDGDYNGTYSITTKFSTLRDDILYLCRSLGFAAYSSIKPVRLKTGEYRDYYRISISGHLDRIPVRIPYKKASPRQQIKDVLHTGFSIEDAGIGEYYGFTLSGDGRFLLGDFTVTHNSTTLFEIANRCTGNVLFLAFNKVIADHAKRKMGENVDCKTFHSYGLGLIKQDIGWYPKVDTNKVYDAIKKYYPYVKNEWNPRRVTNRIIKKMRGLGFMSYYEEDIIEFLNSNPNCFSYNTKERSREEGWAFKNIAEIQFLLKHLDDKPIRQEKNKDGIDMFPKYLTVIDFDDMVRYPCMYDLALKKRIYANTVLVDEAQDMNPYQIKLIRQLFERGVRIICVGDSNQCQPIGTQVLMTGGFYKDIKDVKVGDEVVTYQSKNSYFAGTKSQGRKVLEASSRMFSGYMYTIMAGDKTSKSTPNHKWLTRFNENAEGKFITYLMKKNDKYRIGFSTIVKGYDNTGFALGNRTRVEKADCSWILGIYNNEIDARVDEKILSLKYGIPTDVFYCPDIYTILSTKVNKIFWKTIETTEQSAYKLLKSFNRDIEFPFYVRDEGTHFGKYSFICHTCNLIPEVMSMKVYNNKSHCSKWEPLSLKINEVKNVEVFSLKVENSESESPGRRLYVSDDIVTHNSIYAFRGAYSDSMERLAKTTTARELPLSVTYRCREEIVKFTNKNITKSNMIHHKEGGSVEYIPKSKFVEKVKEHNVSMIIGAKNKSLIKAWLELAKYKISSTLKDKGVTKEIRRILEDYNFVPTKDQPPKIDINELIILIDDAIRNGFQENDEGVMEQTLPLTAVDMYECIKEIIKIHEIDHYTQFLNLLDEMDRDSDHKLHTVHSSKGLESSSVIVLCDWFDNDQLSNMKYVAYTRAEDLLMLVTDWEKEEDEIIIPKEVTDIENTGVVSADANS